MIAPKISAESQLRRIQNKAKRQQAVLTKVADTTPQKKANILYPNMGATRSVFYAKAFPTGVPNV
jgi:hypothetical protein